MINMNSCLKPDRVDQSINETIKVVLHSNKIIIEEDDHIVDNTIQCVKYFISKTKKIMQELKLIKMQKRNVEEDQRLK